MDRKFGFHSPATYAFAGKPLTVQLIVPDEETVVSNISLSYTVELTAGEERGDTLRMSPVDGFVAGDSYSVYSAVIPAVHLTGAGKLSYRFALNGEESGEYTVPLCVAPAVPPLLITEFCARGIGPMTFFELYNPGTDAVDLYDYELLLHTAKGAEGRNPLADEAGVNILSGGMMTAFRFLSPAVRKHEQTTGEDRESFYADATAMYPLSCADIAERAPLLMQSDISEYNEEAAAWKKKKGCIELFPNEWSYRASVVPRGGSEDEALCTVSFNYGKSTYFDLRTRHSSLWRTDPRDPRHPILMDSLAAVTPGYAAHDQALLIPDDTTPPAILPLAPEGRIHLSNGDLTVRFAAIGAHIGFPTVYVKEVGEYVKYPAVMGDDGVWAVKIPYSVLSRMPGRLAYYIEVTGGLYTARYGSAERPLLVRVVDNAGPTVRSVYPAEGQILENEYRPVIEIVYEDVSGVNRNNSILCLDGRNVSQSAKWGEKSVKYRPERPLSYGEHVIEVSLRDRLGNRTYRRNAFSIGNGKELYCYRGEVHSHTSESDGVGMLEDAMAYARDVGKVDYFAVTDHSHFISPREYLEQIARADAFNVPGKFVAIHGFEQTWSNINGLWGHMNVLNTDWITYPSTTDLPELYEKITADKNAVAMFNHPTDRWGDFDSFGHKTPEMDARVCLAEIRFDSHDRHYALQLSKGWHAAPVANEDNHKWNWTTATNSTGVVLAPSLTRENILDGMRRRRTYTTMDNTMKIYYRVNGKWLGSMLEEPASLTVEVEITTESQQGIGVVSLVTEDNIVVARMDAGLLRTLSWEVEIDPDFDYYYLKITNDKIYSVTSPVYIKGRDLLNITALEHGVCGDEKAPNVVAATVKNDSDKPMTDVAVDFYVSALSGFELRVRAPFESVHIGRLEAGETHTVSRRFPNVIGNRRVTAVVRGCVGKNRFADTSYVLLTPVFISKVMPLTSPVEKDGVQIENPFCYAELYNPAAVPMALDGYTLRLRAKTGKDPLPEDAVALDGLTVPPRGTLVVWQLPKEGGLTVADFNTRYGVDLIEGETIAAVQGEFLTAKECARLDLYDKKEPITRVTQAGYCSHKKSMEMDVPVLYVGHPNMTVYETVLSSVVEAPKPGELLEEQRVTEMDGSCSRNEAREAEKAKTRVKLVTRLTKAPLVPLQAAKLIAGAVSTLKGLFSAKE